LGFRRIIWFTRSREGANFEVIICDHCYGRNAEVGERGWEEGWCAVAGTFSRTASSSTFEMSHFASKFTEKNIQALSLKSAMLRGFY
jgi:hypothetical protein